MHYTNTVAASLALLAGSAMAHPGHDLQTEIKERRDFMSKVARSDLTHCAAKLKARGIEQRNVARRSRMVEEARAKRGLKKRTLETVLATDHNATDLGYTAATDAATLFSGNSSCILTPDVTQGPYYVGGEYIRRNIIEEQEGIDTVLDYQVIDVDTCDPVPNVYLEMWHCNSTGVYSGVVASGNGDSSDTSNIDNTFLRGIQATDADGVAQFETLFPGHYTSRATHIHILIHTNATVYPNGTLGNEVSASHVGQAFFDQDLITEADTIAPYSSNTQEVTLNSADSILSEETATDGVDPFFEYTLLGDELADGLFGWIAFGINTTESSTVSPAVFLYASGGVANENSNIGGGSGGGAPPGESGNTTFGDAPSTTSSSVGFVTSTAAAKKAKKC
ncbi:Intradiol ring-cleavage dioxygenase [Pseudomassariella vexata]|uniref:Intradiol ring-cleavage dioxygenase n=1 Tax=Pseudomassariella vexata TaxID=1141098 RepID=A0A1Y2E9S2_9PEZI|nr:Intradiol ring-cleavage dioxygenase [Pseudomassariella vexata]ORY68292.1 Intradiol ring-cleavage dioxygenase [Pseudomassariella vexata]